MPEIEIQLNERQLAELKALLAEMPREMPRVLSRALNKVGVAARTKIVRAVVAEVNLKAGEVKRRNVFLHKASFRNLTAVIRIRGRRIPIRHFGARQTSKGVTYAERRGKRELLPGAFMATMDSGHRGVFFRRPGRNMGGPSTKRRPKWPGTLPIVEQYGHSVPYFVENIAELAKGVLENELANLLEAEVVTQAGLVIERRRPTA